MQEKGKDYLFFLVYNLIKQIPLLAGFVMMNL